MPIGFGGLQQLVAYGAQDVYLTGNPQITHFKQVYRRHTNFSMQYIEQFFDPQPTLNVSKRTQGRLKIERNADLLFDSYLVFDLPDIVSNQFFSFRWIKHIGHHIIYSVEFNVNGQRIALEFGQWMNIWTELTLPNDKRPAYDRMTGGEYHKLRPGQGKSFYPSRNPPTDLAIPATRLYVPFEFWFCKNSGLAVPLIALQYTDVYLYFEFNPLNELFTIQGFSPSTVFTSTDPQLCEVANALRSEGFNQENVLDKFISGTWNRNMHVLCNFIFLDVDERRKFAQQSHEYLIHQVQRRSFTGLRAGNHELEFKIYHPTKELVWVIQKDTVSALNAWHNYSVIDTYDDYKSLKENFYNVYDYIDELLSNTGNSSNKALLDIIGVNGYLDPIENNPPYSVDPIFLGTGLSRTLAFNDFSNVLLSASLIFDGNSREDEKDNTFFDGLQQFRYSTQTRSRCIYVYSFALTPEEFQPSGTCNFSRINKSVLQVQLRRLPSDNVSSSRMDNIANIIAGTGCNGELSERATNRSLTEFTLYLYGLNYNIFRIMSGIGSIAFAS